MFRVRVPRVLWLVAAERCVCIFRCTQGGGAAQTIPTAFYTTPLFIYFSFITAGQKKEGHNDVPMS